MKITETFDIQEQCDTAIALGFFDGVHQGHQGVIAEVLKCAQDGLKPVVFTFTTGSSSPKRKLDSGLLQTIVQREAVLESLGVEHLIIPPFELFSQMTPQQFATDILHKRLRVKVVCCGEDFHFGKGAAANAENLRELLKPYGIKLIAVAPIMFGGEVVSSTRIRECISRGEMETAKLLLGRPYSIEGIVLHGKKLGRTIGFPTANQALPEEMQMPKPGVYQTTVLVDGKTYKGVTNVGFRPTVDDDVKVANAESYIIGFLGDIYGKKITTQFNRFLREEKKFVSVEELRYAIKKDTEDVLANNNFYFC